MSGCMVTGKPRISILMAVYHPRMDWLLQQLDSLNAQRYPNLELLICDDGPDKPVDEGVFRAHITAFPWRLLRNEENIGSNKTFERLTELAGGEYLAYCDQDDVWLPEKLDTLYDAVCSEGAQLACSDMYIIDGDGRTVADSITKIRRHHIFRSGEGLTSTLWYSNFASGCALLVRSAAAKQAIPFNPYMYYDHYITFYSAYLGRIAFVDQPLIQHREHGENQSSTMQGVVDKASYYHLRVEKPYQAVRWLSARYASPPLLAETLGQGVAWLDARLKYLSGQRSFWRTMLRYRRFSPMATMFEIISPWLPKRIFLLFVYASQKNLI